MKKSFNPMWLVAVISAFISFVSFIQIDGEYEKYNTYFWIIGFVFAIVTAYGFYRVATDGSTPKD